LNGSGGLKGRRYGWRSPSDRSQDVNRLSKWLDDGYLKWCGVPAPFLLA
jgi:hypothetical protein